MSDNNNIKPDNHNYRLHGEKNQELSYKKGHANQVYKLCRILNCNLNGVAYFFGVSENEIEFWCEKYPEFKKSLERGTLEHQSYLQLKEGKKAKRRAYRKLPHILKQQNDYIKNRIKTDPKTHLRFNFSSLLRGRLRSKNKTGLFRNLEYSITDLMNHLESQFVDGMNWDNYGKVWHIDHIKPDSLFNYKSMDDKEFIECWALSNLQPLFAKDNLKKSNKYASAYRK